MLALGNFRFDYNYDILPFEICNYRLVDVLSLAQHVSATTVEPKGGQLNVCSSKLQMEKSRIVVYRSQIYKAGFPLGVKYATA